MPKNGLKRFLEKYFNSFSFFYKRLKNKVFVSLILSIAVGFMDGFGLTLFLPLLKMAGGENQNSGDGLGKLEFLVTSMEDLGIELNLVSILTVMVVFFVLKGISQYMKEIYNVKLRQYFISTIRIRLIPIHGPFHNITT